MHHAFHHRRRAHRAHPMALLALTLLTCLAALGCGTHSAASSHEVDAGSDAGTPRTPRLYATLAGENAVVVLDEATHAELAKIPVGKGPAIILATPDASKLYTANWSDNTISSISVATEQAKSIALPGRAYVIAMAPDGKRLYAGLATNQIAVIDSATDKVARFIDTPDLPASVIVSADGQTLYVAVVAGLSGNIRAISAETGDVVHASITVGAAPGWITITPDGSQVYTLNFLSDDVSVVDTASWKVTDTVSTGAGSQAIIGNVTPDGSTLYVTNHGTGELMAIDTHSHAITQTIKLDGRPVGVGFNRDGSRVYVTDFGTQSLAAPPDQTFLLTGQFSTKGNGQISVFDTATGKRIGAKINVGPGPTSLVWLP